MTNASETLLPQPELESGKTVETVAPVARRLNHLQALEAESIYILREAAAEFARPVMLYSIGKDSSVMLRLAQKAFYPGKIPFPLLHVDTSYKFPEMIEFRDSYPRQIGAELIVHKNQEALDAGANPFSLGTRTRRGSPQRFDRRDRSPLATFAGRKNATPEVPHEVPRMRSLHGSDPFRCRHRAEDHRGNGFVPALRTRKPRYRPRRGRFHGTQKAGGIFLMISPSNSRSADAFAGFLEQNLSTELLRFTTAGSVDDGKSTLIGRLLHDSKAVYEDQLASVKKSRINRSTGPIDFSLLTDGLRAEREQGITIDVAYRYFATHRRKFIIADTPGHEQYTRNMATGASTADLAVILIDATKGLLPQTRRHAFIASLLGITNVLAAVNKMDLVEYREDVFLELQDDFLALATQLGIANVQCVPISALEGDNVVDRSKRMLWYQGPTLLEHLETVPLPEKDSLQSFRFPVQTVIRPDATFRGFAGRIASGVVHPGDPVVALPSGRRTSVRSIVTYDGDMPQAYS